MSEQIPKWKQLYPNAKYEPDPKCSKCKGEGVWSMPPEKAKDFKYLVTTDRPCLCIFVGGEHEWVRKSLGETASKELKRLKEKS